MRLFVAIALPEEARAALARFGGGLPGARWVDPQSLHLTLRFVGEVGRGEAEDLDAALSGIHAPAFELAFDGLGTFGNDRAQRALWAGVAANPALEHLRDKVESAAVRGGFEAERRKFKPHITLARLKGTPVDRLSAYLAINGAVAVPSFEVEAFTLFRSHLGDEGARYEPLAEYPLLLS
jgi:2'-5' RNA ligase